MEARPGEHPSSNIPIEGEGAGSWHLVAMVTDCLDAGYLTEDGV